MNYTIQPSTHYYPQAKAGEYQQSENTTVDSRKVFAQKLIAAGIPEATVFQGPQAVEAYITTHNIDKNTLPSPPSGATVNASRQFQGINLNQSNVLPTGSGRILNFNA
jgi:hypothetical protein